MALNILVYSENKYVSTIKFNQSGPHTDNWKLLADENLLIIEVTDFEYLPSTGAFWDGSGFSGTEETMFFNKKVSSMAHFAFVVDNVCVARSDLPVAELSNLVDALRGSPRFEINEIIDAAPKREVKPWDFLNPNTNYASKKEAKQRLDICKGCPFFIKATAQCTKCGCFMHLKTKLADASCPVGNW
jgi:hypothetical protein